MPKLSTLPVVTATTTEEITLSPKVRAKLAKKLDEYASVARQIAALDAVRVSIVRELEDIRYETGQGTLKLEGHGTVTLVAGVFQRFNPKKFVSLGGDLAIYEQAREMKPKKAYTKVTVPGERDTQEEE